MTLEAVSTAIDSQFSAAAQPGPLADGSPLGALGLFTCLCYWNSKTKKVECGDLEWLSMEMLLKGQKFNPECQQLYRNCRSSFSSRWDFWLLVVRSCGSRTPNHDESQLRIIHQALNDPDSVALSRWAHRAYRAATDTESKKYFQILAMYYLLSGQRHSADTMQLYRACFAKDPDELFRRVELIRPIDIEDIAIELNSPGRLRDAVS